VSSVRCYLINIKNKIFKIFLKLKKKKLKKICFVVFLDGEAYCKIVPNVFYRALYKKISHQSQSQYIPSIYLRYI